MRFAVLTRRNAPFGIRLLQRLVSADLDPVCIGIERVTWATRRRRARVLARKTGLANALFHNARIWSRLGVNRLRGRDDMFPYESLGCDSLTATEINAPAMVDFLSAHESDVILLGQSGVIRQPILSLPAMGTLNAHPGWLPTFRGVDVVKWSLLAGGPVGATLHWVDRGIDTGAIVSRQPVGIAEDATIEQVEDAAVDLALDMMVNAAETLARGMPLARTPQKREEGSQHFLMPFATERRLRRSWPGVRRQILRCHPNPRASGQGT